MKKLIIPALAILALAGCSSESNSAPAGQKEPTTQEAMEPPTAPDLTGAWIQNNPKSKESFQQAEIADGTLTIEWVYDGGDTTSVYWVGTFETPSDANEPYTWTSDRDVEATDNALLASTSDSKDFTYEDGEITYEVTALGTTTKVVLEKE
ncbi:membrane lipoprotein lipid attachment site-containing protein [Zhihengliuella flava]|uniref:Lipoprotein NlpE involved in copper resistance n=1 Tax=Zhihengliuella flava TaxID=1285193 RepID=A0A931D6Q4_9MICC|nr:membrane lipoprotein lipid attachment site-containing protein [Zhihengliuella flava]MBG6085454.1 putative lipoprotein NlpE involved in copper resistance [Zhihengliuella flava]